MTRLLLIVVLVLLALPAAAAQDKCTFDFSEIIPMLESAETAGDVAEARALIELQEAACRDHDPDGTGSSRTNPVAYGDPGIITSSDFDATVQLVGYVDDGEEILLNANDDNDPAPDGKRYVLIAFTYTCDRTPDESCDYSRVDFSIVGDKGIAYDYDTVDLRSGSVSDSQEIFGGGSSTIGVAFLVDEDDDNFVMYTEYGRPRTFFATE